MDKKKTDKIGGISLGMDINGKIKIKEFIE